MRKRLDPRLQVGVDGGELDPSQAASEECFGMSTVYAFHTATISGLDRDPTDVKND